MLCPLLFWQVCSQHPWCSSWLGYCKIISFLVMMFHQIFPSYTCTHMDKHLSQSIRQNLLMSPLKELISVFQSFSLFPIKLCLIIFATVHTFECKPAVFDCGALKTRSNFSRYFCWVLHQDYQLHLTVSGHKSYTVDEFYSVCHCLNVFIFLFYWHQ